MNIKESVKIAIDDDEMELLGKQICQQTWLYDGKVLKVFRADTVNKQTYYTEIK